MVSCVVANLLTHVEVGHVLVISGVVKDDGSSVKIQLLNSGENNKKICLEIRADLEQKRITLTADGSNNEEKSEDEAYNVKSISKSFKFYILTTDDKFRISLNEEHLCSFNYRCEVSTIKMIKISGEIDIVKQADHRQIYPYCWPQNHEDLPTIAFSADVPCRFSQNTIVILRMRLSGDENGSFFIRFNEMGSKKQLFHFNPRFNEKEIVCNCMNDKLE
jgi:hypothetical protein